MIQADSLVMAGLPTARGLVLYFVFFRTVTVPSTPWYQGTRVFIETREQDFGRSEGRKLHFSLGWNCSSSTIPLSKVEIVALVTSSSLKLCI